MICRITVQNVSFYQNLWGVLYNWHIKYYTFQKVNKKEDMQNKITFKKDSLIVSALLRIVYLLLP